MECGLLVSVLWCIRVVHPPIFGGLSVDVVDGSAMPQEEGDVCEQSKAGVANGTVEDEEEGDEELG